MYAIIFPHPCSSFLPITHSAVTPKRENSIQTRKIFYDKSSIFLACCKILPNFNISFSIVFHIDIYVLHFFFPHPLLQGKLYILPLVYFPPVIVHQQNWKSFLQFFVLHVDLSFFCKKYISRYFMFLAKMKAICRWPLSGAKVYLEAYWEVCAS